MWEINILYSYLGDFAPVTMGGNIVVDGVLASCYALSDHDLVHIVMTPMRWFPAMMNVAAYHAACSMDLRHLRHTLDLAKIAFLANQF